jgi:hypothetical protein
MTLARSSECGGANYHYPSAADRLVLFYYELGAGVGEYAFQPGDFVHYKGNCSGGWTTLGSGDAPIVIEAYLVDPGNESLGLEVKVDFWGSIAPEQLLGLGFLRYAYNPSGYRALARRGCRVLRIPAEVVLHNLPEAVARIRAALRR